MRKAKCFLVQRLPCDELKFAKRFLCLIALIICERKTEKSGQRSTFYLSFDVEFCWRHSSKDDICHRGDDRRQNNKKGNTLAHPHQFRCGREFLAIAWQMTSEMSGWAWACRLSHVHGWIECVTLSLAVALDDCYDYYMVCIGEKLVGEIEAMPHTMDHMGHLIRNVLILFPTRPTDGECWSKRTV